MKYTDSSNRKTPTYWDEVRPLTLLDEEKLDYRKKDSIEQLSKNPAYLDSVDREDNKVKILGILLTGQTINKTKKNSSYYFRPITDQINYNIVEGLTLNLSCTYTKKLDSTIGRRSIRITPTVRYGFSNGHFNAWLSSSYIFGKKYINTINLSGGKRVFQFNNASPIGPSATGMDSF